MPKEKESQPTYNKTNESIFNWIEFFILSDLAKTL